MKQPFTKHPFWYVLFGLGSIRLWFVRDELRDDDRMIVVLTLAVLLAVAIVPDTLEATREWRKGRRAK